MTILSLLHCKGLAGALWLCAGCRDYAPYLGLSSAVKMWQALGVQRCHAYCRDLLHAAVDLLTTAWSTTTLAPMSMCANMALVALPKGLALVASKGPMPERGPEQAAVVPAEQDAAPLSGPSTSTDAKVIQVSSCSQHA